MKIRQSGFVSITVIVLLVVAAGAIAFTASRVISNSDEQASTSVDEQASSEQSMTTDESFSSRPAVSMVLDTEIDQDTFYSVALDDGSNYYGKVRSINDKFFRISPVYYSEGGVLKVLGSELHGPENAMHVNSDNVTTFSQLGAGETNTAIMQSYEQNKPTEVSDAYPSANIDDYIKDELVQAVFFKDGTSYFAKLSSTEPLTYEGAVYQVRGSSGPGTQPNISLELVPENEVKSLNSDEVLLWENLTPDGQISVAISQYEASR